MSSSQVRFQLPNDTDEQEEEEEEEEVEIDWSLRLPSERLAEYQFVYFDALTDEDFIAEMHEIDMELMRIELENMIFENYLETNEPSLMSGYTAATSTIIGLNKAEKLYPTIGPIPESEVGAAKFRDVEKINISVRTDILLRYVEEMQRQLNQFLNRTTLRKFILKAEIEESSVRNEEALEMIKNFEQHIVIDSVDPITQRIPAEKFVWFMLESLKADRLKTEKIRLRNNSLKLQYTKLKLLQSQKVELGECIQEVDFDQMYIENKNFQMQIDQKNTHLLELKKMTGEANLRLANNKNYMQMISNHLRTLTNAINHTEEVTKKHNQEIVLADKEAQEAKQIYMDVKHLTENFKVPEVIDYVRVKATLQDLKKKLKVLARKENIIEVVTKSKVQMMLKLTEHAHVSPHWFEKNIHDMGDQWSLSSNEAEFCEENPVTYSEISFNHVINKNKK